MKKIITKISIVTMMVLLGNSYKTVAQTVSPTTPNVKLFCAGSTLDLGTPVGGTQWIVRYSQTQTNEPTDQLTLAGNQLTDVQLKTGYFYIISKGLAAGSCESTMQEVIVYKFAPITPAFAFTDYCSENANSTLSKLTGTVTSTDPVTTFAYQWFKVTSSAGVDTAVPISGATTKDYIATETNSTNADVSTTYRLQVGYDINGAKYCAAFIDHAVKVLAKPTKPNVTITPATAGSW